MGGSTAVKDSVTPARTTRFLLCSFSTMIRLSLTTDLSNKRSVISLLLRQHVLDSMSLRCECWKLTPPFTAKKLALNSKENALRVCQTCALCGSLLSQQYKARVATSTVVLEVATAKAHASPIVRHLLRYKPREIVIMRLTDLLIYIA